MSVKELVFNIFNGNNVSLILYELYPTLIISFIIFILIIKSKIIWNWIDLQIMIFFEPIFYMDEQRACAVNLKIISNEWIKPDKNELESELKIQALLPLEGWLSNYPINYSLFFNYKIEKDKLMKSFKILLQRIPIIGGIYCKYNESLIGVDYRDPKIQFIYGFTSDIPSTDYKDFNNDNWFMKYTNGCSTMLPYPKGKPVFKVTLIHFNNNNNDIHTLLVIGCTHGLCDATGFWYLLDCLSKEMKGESWETPVFNRDKLLIKDNELKYFNSNDTILNKHVGNTLHVEGWWHNSIWPPRHWIPWNCQFTKTEINNLKTHILNNGKASKELKEIGRISSNDVIVSLFWKIRAILNDKYSLNEPIICTMVIDTRRWLPERFDHNNKAYFGNGLGFLLLHLKRKELIEYDLSEIILYIRKEIKKLNKNEFENDLHLYTHLTKNNIDNLHWYQGRWCVNSNNYWYSRYIMDRDMMVSNLIRINTYSCDLGNGNTYKIKFNHMDEICCLGYMFVNNDKNMNLYDYYNAIPINDLKFYENVNFKDPKLNWDNIIKKIL